MLESLSRPEAIFAAARSRAHAAFGQAIEYPDEQFCKDVRAGAVCEALQGVLATVDPSLLQEADLSALSDAGEKDDLMVEYTRLFIVGAPGPACPLYGGLYGGTRNKTLEELDRFYNHFGLSASKRPSELPDYLGTELEFLHYLAFHEARLLEAGEDVGSCRRAQRDFLARHPAAWVPKLRVQLKARKPMRFFAELIRLLELFLEHDFAHLVALEGPVPSGSPPSPRSREPS